MLFQKLALLINYENNNYNVKNTKTLKTFLMLSIASMMLILGGIIPVHASSGDVFSTVEINSSTVNGVPLSTDCDDTAEYGRVMLDAQGSTENTLYLCTASGWIAK